MGHNKNSGKVASNVQQDDRSAKTSKTAEASAFSQNTSKKK